MSRLLFVLLLLYTICSEAIYIEFSPETGLHSVNVSLICTSFENVTQAWCIKHPIQVHSRYARLYAVTQDLPEELKWNAPDIQNQLVNAAELKTSVMFVSSEGPYMLAIFFVGLIYSIIMGFVVVVYGNLKDNRN